MNIIGTDESRFIHINNANKICWHRGVQCF